MSEVTDFLLEAKNLIVSPEKWIKGSFERGDCYCMAGALYHVILKPQHGDTPVDVFDQACTLVENTLVREKTGFLYMPEFNDDPSTTHADVMKIMDLAIERSKQ